jgi:putative transposase
MKTPGQLPVEINSLSQKTAKLMVLTLVQAASKTWHRLHGSNQLPHVVEGVIFTNGVATIDASTHRAA